ncbi:MAG: DUF2461 domain-containing protein [Bryobacterales bacterium]|nr:DUF2461 domain-containing protein [Bryobacterales bacterium]
MKSPFRGFPPEARRFLRALKKNNNRDWFEAHKETFLHSVKAPMEELVTAVSAALGRFAPAYVTEPKKAIFRIYRDTRFSPDKTPYKTHVGALFSRADLPKNQGGAFYFHIAGDEFGLAGGVYSAESGQLLALRNHLAANHEQFRKLAASKHLINAAGEIQGEKLARAPKGFAPDHPAIELLRGKQWYFWRLLDPKVAETPDAYQEIVNRFERMCPVVEFLNTPLIALAKKTQRLKLE